jgi:hypothetical protein
VHNFGFAKFVPVVTKKTNRTVILCFLKEENTPTHFAQSSKRIAQMFHHKTLSYERTFIVILLFLAHQNFEKS